MKPDTNISDTCNSTPSDKIYVELGEICQITSGITKGRKRPNDELREIPYMAVANVQDGHLALEQIKTIEASEKEIEKYQLQKDDLLLTEGGDPDKLGRGTLWQEEIKECIHQNHIFKVRKEVNVVDMNFLSRQIASPAGKAYFLSKAKQTTGIASINLGQLRGFPVWLPPLNEQRRIADKLDTTLAAVEACKQKLNNAAETIQRFRQSVLAAAVSGELTREWREERGTSKDSWQNLRLRDIGEFGRGKSKHRPRNDPRLFGGAYPFIQTGEVAKSEELITEHKQTLSEFGLKQSKLWPTGTLCITIAANIADTAILSYPACFPDSVVGFIADQQKAKTKYIKWLIESIASDLERFAPATAQKNINLAILDEIELAIPSIDEQDAAVMQGQELLDYANGIESQISKALEQTTLLAKSLLAKAFRGELVPQDPSDEPASVLLERIKAQREAEAAAKKPAKRGRKKKTDPAQLVIPEGIADNHLAKVLEECGALSERALLAASELAPEVFQLQLSKELGTDGLKQVDVSGEAAYADAAWEEEG